MSSCKKRSKTIDGLKVLGVLYVILHHFTLYEYYKPLYFITGQGQVVVIWLFVLSGYIVGRNYSSKKTLTISFLKHRFLRIYPTFVVSLLITYFLASWHAKSWVVFPVREFLGNLMNIQDLGRYDGVWQEVFMHNTPLWYVSYIWWFYILFFLIHKIKEKNRLNLVSLLSILATIIFYFSPSTPTHILSYFVIWWSGVEIARWRMSQSKYFFSQQIRYLFISILLIIILYACGLFERTSYRIWSYPLIEIRHFLYAMSVLLLFWGIQHYKVKLDFINRFSSLSYISYGLFVFHYPILIIYNPFVTSYVALNLFLASGSLFLVAYLFDYKLNRFLLRLTKQ